MTIIYLRLFIANIIADDTMIITTAAMVSVFSFWEIPIKRSPINITKRKIYAKISMGADLFIVAKASINPSANCR